MGLTEGSLYAKNGLIHSTILTKYQLVLDSHGAIVYTALATHPPVLVPLFVCSCYIPSAAFMQQAASSADMLPCSLPVTVRYTANTTYNVSRPQKLLAEIEIYAQCITSINQILLACQRGSHIPIQEKLGLINVTVLH